MSGMIPDAVEEHERRLTQQFLDRSRRARLAAFEASDPDGRLAEMTSRHSAEARRLAADYGFEPPKPPTAEDIMKAWLTRSIRAQMISHLGRLDSFTALGCRSRDDR